MQWQREIVIHAAYLTPNWWMFEAILSGLAVILFIYFFLICPYIRYGIIWATRMKAQTEKRPHSYRSRLSLKWWQLFFFPWHSPHSELPCLTNTSNHPEVLSLLLSGYCWRDLFAWHNTVPSDIKRQQEGSGTVGNTNNCYSQKYIENFK